MTSRIAISWMAVAVAFTGCRRTPADLPVYGALGAFALTDQSGRSFGSAELAGSPYVADFFFTRCPDVCPVLTEKMQGLERRAAKRKLSVQFVSFSVDPKFDTPEVLQAYAREHRIVQDRWHLLTGGLDRVESLTLRGFHIAMGREDTGGDDFMGIFHGDHFVLVDPGGRIRGYYGLVEDPKKADQLLDDAELLTRR